MRFLVIFLSQEFDVPPGNLDNVEEYGSRKRYVTIHFVGRGSDTRSMLYLFTIRHIFYIWFLGVVFSSSFNLVASNLYSTSRSMIAN